MQRISIEKNEAVADLIERILEVQDHEIILVVPKGSHLTDSASNFRLIAREAGVLAKDISIESVDENVLERARAAGLKASHPLFDGREAAADGAVSDIVPRGRKKAAEKEKVEKKLKVKVRPSLEEARATMAAAAGSTTDFYDAGQDDEEEAEATTDDADKYDAEIESSGGTDEERYDTLEEPHSGRGSRKLIGWIIVAVVIIGGIMALTAYAFGRATVTVNFRKTEWSWNGTVVASVAAKNLDATSATIPAELAMPTQSKTQSYPATGHTSGGTKAHGMLTIVNNYSDKPQELVATTRFQAPDGKIYRMDSATIVPAAKVDGAGKIIETGSIKVAVTADKAGPEYNTGTVEKLTIPGFKGTPKFAGFYGMLPDGAAGGSTNGGPVPTDTDIKNAKAALVTALDQNFQATFLASVPAELKVLPGAYAMSTTTYGVSQAVDDKGNFTVTASTLLQAFEIRERDVVDLLNLKAKAQGGEGKELQDMVVNYSKVTPNFAGKKMSFTLDAKGVLAPVFDPAAFASQVAGKSRDEAREALLGLPELQDANVSLWPAWAWMLPKTPSRISVIVE